MERWRENLPLVCFVTSWLVNLKVTLSEKKAHTDVKVKAKTPPSDL